MNSEIANIFWHGDLSTFEIVCIKSFVQNGFHVKLWSYNGLSVEGAESCDARLVLSENHLTKYKQKHFAVQDESKETYSTLSAFSDAFRWNVINKFGGWWFDADCYCLKSSIEFERLRHNKSFISGLQNCEYPSVACGAFYADKHVSNKLVNKLNELCKLHNFAFDGWGVIGPLLISNVVQDENLYDGLLSAESFYSIESSMTNYYIDPELKDQAKAYISDSYITHIWHSWINYFDIDKENPPNDSLLKEFFNNTYTNVSTIDKDASLRYDTSLKKYVTISKLYKKILNRNGTVHEIASHVRSNLELKQILFQLNLIKNNEIN